MILVTRQAVNVNPDFGDIIGIHLVDDGMMLHRVSSPVFERQVDDLTEVILWKADFAVKNGYQMGGIESLRLGVRAVTFQTKRINVAPPQNVFELSPVGFMADGTSLIEEGLVGRRLLALLKFFRVADETCDHDRGSGKPRPLPGMWVVTVNALAQRPRMLYLGCFNLLFLILMAHDTQLFGGLLRQDDLSIFCWLVADFTTLFSKWLVQKCLHQLGRPGLVRIMTTDAVGLGERLPVMSVDERLILCIVAVEAQRRRGLGQVVGEFTLVPVTRFVSDVTCVATHIERRMPTATLWNVHSLSMTGET